MEKRSYLKAFTKGIESMQNVVPDAVSFEEMIPDVMYVGLDNCGMIVGHMISTTAQSYGGQVKVMTGIQDGIIIGLDVFYKDDETPDLGKNTSNEGFRDRYKGFPSSPNIHVSKDSAEGLTIDAVTSATISSHAVTKAVNEALKIYNENVDVVFSGTNGPTAIFITSKTAKEGE